MSLRLSYEERMSIIEAAAARTGEHMRKLHAAVVETGEALAEQSGIYNAYQNAYGEVLTRFEVLNAELARLRGEYEQDKKIRAQRSRKATAKKPVRRKRKVR